MGCRHRAVQDRSLAARRAPAASVRCRTGGCFLAAALAPRLPHKCGKNGSSVGREGVGEGGLEEKRTIEVCARPSAPGPDSLHSSRLRRNVSAARCRCSAPPGACNRRACRRHMNAHCVAAIPPPVEPSPSSPHQREALGGATCSPPRRSAAAVVAASRAAQRGFHKLRPLRGHQQLLAHGGRCGLGVWHGAQQAQQRLVAAVAGIRKVELGLGVVRQRGGQAWCGSKSGGLRSWRLAGWRLAYCETRSAPLTVSQVAPAWPCSTCQTRHTSRASAAA